TFADWLGHAQKIERKAHRRVRDRDRADVEPPRPWLLAQPEEGERERNREQHLVQAEIEASAARILHGEPSIAGESGMVVRDAAARATEHPRRRERARD